MFRRLIPVCYAILLSGCGLGAFFVPGNGEGPRNWQTVPETFRFLSLHPVFLDDFHRDPASATKEFRKGWNDKPDSVIHLTAGLGIRGRLAVDFSFTWSPVQHDTVAMDVLGGDLSGFPSPPESLVWNGGKKDFAPGDTGSGQVTFRFSLFPLITFQPSAHGGILPSAGQTPIQELQDFYSIPMPDSEGEALLAPLAGEWRLVGQNNLCGPDTMTWWVGASQVPPRVLVLGGRAGIAGHPDSTRRDSVLLFTGGRLSTHHRFLGISLNDSPLPDTANAWVEPLSWLAGKDLLVLSRRRESDGNACPVDWVFARGALLSRLTGAAP